MKTSNLAKQPVGNPMPLNTGMNVPSNFRKKGTGGTNPIKGKKGKKRPPQMPGPGGYV